MVAGPAVHPASTALVLPEGPDWTAAGELRT